jgi:UDP-glucose 4-epimerase
MTAVTSHDFVVSYTDSRSNDVPEIYLDIIRATNKLYWNPFMSLEYSIK